MSGQAPLNGYIAFFKGKQIEVHARTSLEAQTIAAKKFRAKRRYEVSVHLCEKNNEQITHLPFF